MGVEQRRIRERQQREVLIMEAALRVFAERGIKDATIEDIASEAELGKGTIYYYFSSKEAVLEAAIQGTVDAMFAGLLEQVESLNTPFDIARVIIQGCVDNFRRAPAMFKLVYMVLAEPPERYPGALKAFVDHHLDWLDELRGQTRSLLEGYPIDVQTLVHFVGTQVHGMMVLAASGSDIGALARNTLDALEKILSHIQEAEKC